jgi:hypothetical protein
MPTVEEINLMRKLNRATAQLLGTSDSKIPERHAVIDEIMDLMLGKTGVAELEPRKLLRLTTLVREKAVEQLPRKKSVIASPATPRVMAIPLTDAEVFNALAGLAQKQGESLKGLKGEHVENYGRFVNILGKVARDEMGKRVSRMRK